MLSNILKEKPLQSALLINSILFAFIYALYIPYFQTNDDVGMMLRVSGISRVSFPSAHMLHTNIIIGYVLQFLYKTLPSISWYGFYLISGLFTAHTVFLYLAIKQRPTLATPILYTLYFLLLGATTLLELQFTIVAILLSVSGLCLLLFDTSLLSSFSVTALRQYLFRPTILFGISLYLLGTLVRIRGVWLLSMALFAPLLLSYLYYKGKTHFISKLIPFSLSLLLAISLLQYHKYVYAQDEGWSYYTAFNPLRSKFLDDRLLEHTDPLTKQKALQNVGWSLNDYNMLMHWFFLDKDRYNPVIFNNILSSVAYTKERVPLPQVFSKLNTIFGSWYFIKYLLFSLLVLLLLSRLGKSVLWSLLGTFFISFCLFLYLILYLKSPPERVYQPIFYFLGILPLLLPGTTWFTKNTLFSSSKKLPFILLAVILLLLQGHSLYNYWLGSNQKVTASKELFAELADIAPTTESLYITWAAQFRWDLVLPFGDLSLLKNFNTVQLGVSQQAPESTDMLKRYGIDNLYTALASQDNVYLLLRKYAKDHKIDLYSTYMSEHYNLSVSPRLLHESNPFYLYRFTSDQSTNVVKSDTSSTSSSFVLQKNGISLSLPSYSISSNSSYISSSVSVPLLTPNKFFAKNKLRFAFEVLDFELGNRTAGFDKLLHSDEGQHVRVLLNNKQREAINYHTDYYQTVQNGHHLFFAFLSTSYYESIKTADAYILKQFTVGKKKLRKNIDLGQPFLFYNMPLQRVYTQEEAEQLLFDFYLVNTEISPTGNKIRLIIDGTTNFIIDQWSAYLLSGLTVGEHSISIQLTNNYGKNIEGKYTSAHRKIWIE